MPITMQEILFLVSIWFGFAMNFWCMVYLYCWHFPVG